MKIYDINIVENNNKRVYIVEIDEHKMILGVTFVTTLNNELIKVMTTNHKGESKTYKRIPKEYKELFKDVLISYLLDKHYNN